MSDEIYKDPLLEYFESLFDKQPLPNWDEDPSLDPDVIMIRKILIDAAFDGNEYAKGLLKKYYGLTYLYKNGKEIIL